MSSRDASAGSTPSWSSGGLSDAEFAQALSKVRRAEKRGDRSREPTVELRTLLERAEGLIPKVA